jgi:beta-lactamase regulating signal transducer with metallopeptidase domain
LNLLATVLISLSLAFAFSSFIASGLASAVYATQTLRELCANLVVMCIESLHAAKIMLPWLAIALVAGGAVYGVSNLFTRVVRARKAIKKLPLAGRAGSVVLIDDDSCVAFTHGFLDPKIYLSKGLFKRLERDELKSVFVHELHHRKNKDPFKFAMLCLVKDAFFYAPLFKHLAGRIRLKKELDADDAARRLGIPGLSLASAIAKAARSNLEAQKTWGAWPLASISGFDDQSVEVRLKRLIEGKAVRPNMPARSTIALSIMLLVFLSASIAMPVGAGFSKDQNMDCKTHCLTEAHRH